jgi:hypothetical protein
MSEEITGTNVSPKKRGNPAWVKGKLSSTAKPWPKGTSGNPSGETANMKKQRQLDKAFHQAISKADYDEIINLIITKAKAGDAFYIKLLLEKIEHKHDFELGKAVQPHTVETVVDIDKVKKFKDALGITDIVDINAERNEQTIRSNCGNN